MEFPDQVISVSSFSSSSSSTHHPRSSSQNPRQRGRTFNARGNNGFQNRNSYSNRYSQPRLRGNDTATVNVSSYYRSNGFVNRGPFSNFPHQPLPQYDLPPYSFTPMQDHDQYLPYFNPSPQPPILPYPLPPQFPLDYLPIDHPYFNEYSNINPYPGQDCSAFYGALPNQMVPPPPPVQYYFNMEPAPAPVLPVPPRRPQALPVQNLSDPEADLRAAIRKQIEYYFSEENLVKDDYLKSKMDEEGWVSAELIAGFYKVARMTHNVELVLRALRPSQVVEVQGNRMRRRGDWRRFVVQQQIPSTSSSASVVEETADNSEEDKLIAGVQSIQLEPKEDEVH